MEYPIGLASYCFCTNGFFLLKCGMVHYIHVYQRVTGYNFKKMLYFSLKIVFVSKFASSADPDEMPHYVALHLGLHCLPKY